MSGVSPSSGSGPPGGPEPAGGSPGRRWRPPQRPLGRVGKWVAVAVIAAFVLNYWLASRSLSEPARLHIPYSPLFLDQVRAGNVDRITSKGTSLQGLFKTPVRYPPSGSNSGSSKRFSTLIPSFADTKALSQLLEEENVVINAEPLVTGAAWWETLVFGFGKTLLARAVAGEAGVPFFSMSASEFIEAIVGVGASRVRDLFKQAKAASPAIVFIDELDAVGRSRSAGQVGGGGGDEREQTLNQILTEMDGFDEYSGVIVVAATNRPDILDAALLRPGRFDRRVAVQPPDRVGRRKILEVHTRNIPLANDLDLDRVAGSTPGIVGADLANLVNEAALLAVRRGHERVRQADFTDAVEKIILGTERKVVLSEDDRRRIAYHEGGHAIVGMLTPGADPVRKVSIIPRGMSLGVTLSTPEDDQFNYSEEQLRGKIKVSLGGRVAEELVFGDVTTGAESDIQQLTRITRSMVGRWGMSDEIGPLAVLPQDGQAPLLPGAEAPSEATQELVDREARRIVEEAQDEVRELLRDNRDKLDSLAEALLERETLDEPDAYAAAGIDRRPAPVASA